jgi:hypothetical protein
MPPTASESVGASVEVAPPAAEEDPCLEGHRRIEEYAALYAEPTEAGLESARRRFWPLIALVPDPVESGHMDDFDSVLEGIEEAVAEGGGGEDAGAPKGTYVRDRSWLPWSGRNPDPRVRACSQKQPGVVLYRPTEDPNVHAALLVLLVGETPTWGLWPDAFAAALQMAREHEEAAGRDHRILGPTFSGTVPSLAAALRHGARSRTRSGSAARFVVSSGTATDPRIRRTLERGSDGGEPSGEGRSVTYWSATADDDKLLGTMLDYLDMRGGHATGAPCRIVVLSESQTGYGASLEQLTVRDVCWHALKFPPNLYGIREAYESVAAVGADAGTWPPLAHDSPPSGGGGDFSEQTATVHDLDLREVLQELSEKRVRFVGILATDANDVVFMARRIHEQLPDVQLFTMGADMRYLHPANAPFMNGVLVAHSAATPPDGGAWSTALESEPVRNVYLAGRYLLTGAPPERGPVIISLISNGAMWQVGPDEVARTAPSTGTTDTVGNARAIQGSPRAPVSFAFVAVISGLVFAACALLVFAPSVAALPPIAARLEKAQTIGFLRHRGRLWSLIGLCEHVDLSAQDRLVTAALLSVTLCPPLLMLVSRFSAGGQGGIAVVSASVVVVVVVMAALWRKAYSGWGRADTATRVTTVLATLVSVMSLELGCGPQREATFNLMSGASPVLAALIALSIFTLCIGCWRVRLRYLDSHRFGVREGRQALFGEMRPPIAQALGEEDGESGTGLAAVERRVMDIIERPWGRFFAVPATINLLLLASFGGPILIKPPNTFERDWRSLLLVALGCLSFLPISGNLSRLLATWIAFRRLLVRLATSPCLEALRRLPPQLARPVEVQLGASGSEITDLACVLSALSPVCEMARALATSHTKCRQLLDAELRYEAGVGPADAKARGRRAELADSLLDVSAQLSRSRVEHEPAMRDRIDDYVASLVAVFVTRYVRHFRLYVPPLIAGSVLSALLTSLYYIQPTRLISTVLFVWVAGIVLSVFAVYVSLDRDPVISAIGKREAGVVTWNWAMLQRVLTWGVLPLASLLAAQYPEVAGRIASLFDALSKGFR